MMKAPLCGTKLYAQSQLLTLTLWSQATVFGFCMLLLPSIQIHAQQTSADDGSRITVNPEAIQPVNGKLPASVLLAVSLKTCAAGSDISKDSVVILGAGLSLEKAKAGLCDITGTLTIDPATSPGKFRVMLVNSDGEPIDNTHASISVLDSGAGAIPPGLAPQVDVMWDVLSQNVCTDVFGRRVAKYFYCIEVKVGNNAGHPLQLAGIGFSQHVERLESAQLGILANSSYASTRAVLLREEVLSPRNLLFHSIQAAGLLMAGFTPYFHAANASAHYLTAVAIVAGPLLQAINIIGPDRVVTQLNNLDDQSFRDSQIIPNNTQIRTTVFVEKRALTELIAALPVPNPEDNKSNPALSNYKNVPAEQIAESIDNSQQKNKFSWSQLGAGGDFSPYIVKRALGNLVVVGDQIEYLQRIQVQSASTGGSSALSVTPSQIDFGNIQSGLPSGVKTVTVSNTGGSVISGLTVAITGTNKDSFSETTTCSNTITTGSSCTIAVIANLKADGVAAATLSVAYSGGSTQNVSLAATGNGLGLSWSPTTLTFVGQDVGTASKPPPGIITLTNGLAVPVTGGLLVAVSGDNAGDFTQTSTCPIAGAVLAPKAVCNVTVTFTPSAKGTRTATLQVTYTIGGIKLSPSFTLSGTGQ
jgi:hypothetical protein